MYAKDIKKDRIINQSIEIKSNVNSFKCDDPAVYASNLHNFFDSLIFLESRLPTYFRTFNGIVPNYDLLLFLQNILQNKKVISLYSHTTLLEFILQNSPYDLNIFCVDSSKKFKPLIEYANKICIDHSLKDYGWEAIHKYTEMDVLFLANPPKNESNLIKLFSKFNGTTIILLCDCNFFIDKNMNLSRYIQNNFTINDGPASYYIHKNSDFCVYRLFIYEKITVKN